jgi:HAD superfamily hydrolase (TIGR01509 family)
MIKAVIFDMDGVIVNSEPVHELSNIKTLKENYNVKLTEKLIAKTKGMKEVEAFELYKKEYNFNDSFENYLEQKKINYEKIAYESEYVFLGADKKLKELSKKFKLALATSVYGDFFKISSGFFNKNIFNVIVKGNEVKKGKPNPEIFLKAIKKLKLYPNECIIVEDAVKGVEAAKKAGCKCIGVLGTFSKKELYDAGADLIVNNIVDITPEMIRNV